MCINVPGLEFLEEVVPGAIKILCMHNTYKKETPY